MSSCAFGISCCLSRDVRLGVIFQSHVDFYLVPLENFPAKITFFVVIDLVVGMAKYSGRQFCNGLFLRLDAVVDS